MGTLNSAQTEHLTSSQLDQLKEDQLRALKERLVQRLNVITKRLHKEILHLQSLKRQSGSETAAADLEEAEQRDDGGQTMKRETDGGDNLQQQQEECQFRIDIIKQRLAKHEQTAIHKMNRLSDLLDSYPPQTDTKAGGGGATK